MKRVTRVSLFLSITIVLTILLILCAQALNSFQILVQTDLSESGDVTSATPPRNMFEGANDLWTHGARFLAMLLVLWSGVWPHAKLLCLLFVIHSGIKFPRVVQAIEWLGRWVRLSLSLFQQHARTRTNNTQAFLDVYFVVLVTLCFSLDKVKACLFVVCEDIGWLQAVPRTGIFIFASGAVLSQCLSRMTVRSLWYQVSYYKYDETTKRDDDKKKKMTNSIGKRVVLRSWLAFTFTALLLLCFVWSQVETLFTVTYSTSLGTFVKFDPSERSFSLLQVWEHMFYEMSNLDNGTYGFSGILIILCAFCVTFVPLIRLMLLCVLCFCRHPLHLLRGHFKIVRDLEHISSFWCHTSVFSAALLLLVFEIKYLSNQFDATTIVNAAMGQVKSSSSSSSPNDDLMGSLLSMSIGTIAQADATDSSQLLDIEILPNRNALNALILISILTDIITWVVRYVFNPGWCEDLVEEDTDKDVEEESVPLLGADDDDNDDEQEDNEATHHHQNGGSTTQTTNVSNSIVSTIEV